VFSPTSFWNQALPGSVPIDPSSATYVGSLVKQVEEAGASFEFRDWSVPCWIVGPNTPTQTVNLDVADGTLATMRSALAVVPIPVGLRPPGPWPTGDHIVAIYQPSTDKYWEMHGVRQVGICDPAKTGVAGCSTLEVVGWHCDNAAAIKEASKSAGYFQFGDWPGVPEGTHWGCSGSGLYVWGGAIKVAEAQRGYIPHAVRMECVTRQNTPRWPAQKTDGSSTNAAMPQEGMIFKLPRASIAKVSDPFVKAVARAANEYGLILTDGAGNVSIKCESQSARANSQTYAPDAWKGPADAYGSGGAILAKAPGELLAEFPFADLEVVAESYRPSSVAPGMLARAA
jgi:hypothetical protein